MNERSTPFKHFRASPARILLTGYLSVIALGTLVLVLPICQASGGFGGFLDMLFTSVSAVCVTGLLVVDTPTHFSTFGHLVLLILIQIGGLGYMTVASLLFLALGRRIGFADLLTLKLGMGSPTIGGTERLLWLVVKTVLVIEGVGFLLFLPVFIPREGIGAGIFHSLFHSVSAFNNAGFSLFSNSLADFRASPYVLVLVALLVIVGGIGFLVIQEVSLKGFRNLSLHTRLVLTTTGVLLIIGMIGFWLFEGMNPSGEWLSMTSGEKFLSGFFASITARTAGFTTLDYAGLSGAALILTIALMVIGASPGGTGGGIKTTTIAITAAASLNVFRGRHGTVILGRRLGSDALITAFSLVFWAIVVLLGSTTLLLLLERASPIVTLFECASALGTVGLSMGLTEILSAPGKLLIMFLMLIGRVGPLTFGLAMFLKEEKGHLRYPVEDVLVG